MAHDLQDLQTSCLSSQALIKYSPHCLFLLVIWKNLLSCSENKADVDGKHRVRPSCSSKIIHVETRVIESLNKMHELRHTMQSNVLRKSLIINNSQLL